MASSARGLQILQLASDLTLQERDELVRALANGNANGGGLDENGEIDNSGLLRAMEAISDSVPDERWAELPEDAAANLDEYLRRGIR